MRTFTRKIHQCLPSATLTTRPYSTTLPCLLSTKRPKSTSAATESNNGDERYVGTLLPHHDSPPPNSIKLDRGSLTAGQTSINEEMHDLPHLKPANAIDPPDTEITTLSNGIRVVSQDTFRQCSTVSALVQVGSRYESEETAGCTHLIEQMAFKSTAKRSHADVVGALETIGGVPNATASREEIVYSIDVLRENTKEAMEILSEVISEPLMLPEELEESRQIVGFLLEMSKDQVSGNIQGNVMEELTSVAFGGENDKNMEDSMTPLGRPLYCDPLRTEENGSMPVPNIDTVRQFHGNHYRGENIVISAAGLSHEEAVHLSEKYFGHIPKSVDSNIQKERETSLIKNEYVGGSRLVHVPNLDYVHLGIGFETGGWHDDDLVPACVLIALLGGGDSFSAGGPGKGMYSRLYRDVLNMCGWVESILGVSLIQTDVGCVGIVGSTDPQYAANLYRVMCDQWLRIANEPVDDIALSRARNRLKSSVLMNLESRLVLGDDMARQVATYGERQTASDVCSRIDAVTSDDLIRIAKRGLNNSPSVVAYGDLTHIPDNIHELVAQALGCKV